MYYTYIIHMLYICFTYIIHILYMYYTYVLYIYYTCIIHVLYIYYTYIIHILYIYYTYIIHIYSSIRLIYRHCPLMNSMRCVLQTERTEVGEHGAALSATQRRRGNDGKMMGKMVIYSGFSH